MCIRDRAYTPGVAEPCLEIAKDESLAYEYTRKGNLVAVITDGTAVLGLGDIGPSAGMPVMEGKCALFKRFAGIDAFPLCVDSKDPKVIVDTIANISKSFGGINLEDLSLIHILFSAGKIGYQVELAPGDLAKVTNCAFADLTTEHI